MSLAVLVPVLGRPEHMAPLLDSIRATCDARVVWLATQGDDGVLAAINDLMPRGVEVGQDLLISPPRERGDYAAKINWGIRCTTEEHIFTGASDLRFHPGWYEAVCGELRPGIGVVGTNDLGNRRTMNGRHATHMLVTRAYVEQFGTIDEPGKFFHEGYPHELVDDEAVATARHRRAYAHACDAYVEHLHPLWGKAEWDDTYAAISDRLREGQSLYRQRRQLWR